MGRRERPLDPGAGAVSAFANGLRELRRAAGSPSYRKMARLAHYSDTVLSVSASGDAMPSLSVTLGYVRACGGDEAEWERRWTETIRQVERTVEAGRGNSACGAKAFGWTAAWEGPASELAAGTADFAGRHTEQAALSERAQLGSCTGSGPDRARILLVTGAPGVGKTTMVLRWAQSVADSFCDGQLYVNLRGYDPSGQPVDPAQAIRDLLDAYGVAASRLPASCESQIGLYRTMLSGKRLLVVLDNARDAEQVRPLLPGAQGCLTVVTGRDQLASLVAAEGARPLQLGPLTEPDALELLALRLGRERVAAEPDAAREVVTLCARLPLALSAAATRAVTRPALSLASLASDLADPRTCLDVLDTGDEATSVRAALSSSFDRLNDAAGRLFCLLGRSPAPQISLVTAARLADLEHGDAAAVIGELVRAHLLIELSPGQYGLNNLLRAFAAERAREHITDFAGAISHVLGP